MTQAEPPVGRLGATSIDCPNPAELADFYARLLGMRRMVETPDGSVVAITDGAHVLAMMRAESYAAPAWPDAGRQMHLDVSVTDLDAAVTRAERLGARQAGHQPQPALWRVMLDPVGHPFCSTTVEA